jgi:hypothetical protein
MPSAIAPEETTSTSIPRERSAAICFAQSAMAVLSRPAPALVSRLEPILTTMRRAPPSGEVISCLAPHASRLVCSRYSITL